MSEELPHGWIWSTIGEVCHNPQYGWTTKASKTGSLRLLRTTDITSGTINWNAVPFCDNEPENKEKYLLKDGDIVISRAGSIGYSLLIKSPQHSVFASYLIRFLPLINEKFVAYFLRSPYYWNSISESKIGIAVPNVNATKLKQVSVPIAPFNEQHRIVAKIEELFTKLDAGVEAMKQVQAQLKRYRQSVLKAAMEGRLTAEWREQHKDELEPVDKLLERIHEEREAKLGEKSRELKPVETSGLPELPDEWKWVSLNEISWDTSYGTSAKCSYDAQGIPVLRIPNISNGVINLSDLKFVADPEKIKGKAYLSKGDFLIIRTNGSRDLIGRAAIIRNEISTSHYFASYLIRFRILGSSVISQWLNYFWRTSFVRRKIFEKAATSAGQYNISQSKLVNFVIPLAPIKELELILKQIDRIFSIIDESELNIESELKRVQSLRHSILKRAFEGKLAPQDPNDEPASVLLERIKAEKAKPKKSKQMEMF